MKRNVALIVIVVVVIAGLVAFTMKGMRCRNPAGPAETVAVGGAPAAATNASPNVAVNDSSAGPAVMGKKDIGAHIDSPEKSTPAPTPPAPVVQMQEKEPPQKTNTPKTAPVAPQPAVVAELAANRILLGFIANRTGPTSLAVSEIRNWSVKHISMEEIQTGLTNLLQKSEKVKLVSDPKKDGVYALTGMFLEVKTKDPISSGAAISYRFHMTIKDSVGMPAWSEEINLTEAEHAKISVDAKVDP